MEGAARRRAHSSALAIVPPAHVWERVQGLRAAHDRQAARWPPHINLVYPFVPESEFEEAAAELVPMLRRRTKPFRLRLARIAYFKHGRGHVTAWLEPEVVGEDGVEGGGALRALHEACEDVDAFAHCVSARAFVPHLTVGQFESEAEALQMIENVDWQPLEFEVDHVQLIARGQHTDEPFRPAWRVSLGKGVDLARAVRRAEPGDWPLAGAPPRTSEAVGVAHDRQASENTFELTPTHARLCFTLGGAVSGGAACEPCAAPYGGAKLLFVVDKSYSMHDEYGRVKSAVRYMVEQTAAARLAEPDFVAYCRGAQRMSAAQVLASKPGFNTNFGAAFTEIERYIREQRAESEVYVVFMTDGDDTATVDLPLAKARFASFLATCGRRVVVHTIGFNPGHKRAFLDEIRVLGVREGVYRYAESPSAGADKASATLDLNEQFQRMFDFLLVATSRTLRVGSHTLCVDGERRPDGRCVYDVLLPRAALELGGSGGEPPRELAALLEPGLEVVTLQRRPPGVLFALRVLEEECVDGPEALQRVQRALGDVKVHRAPKHERAGAVAAKALVQQRLDAYHALFARAARGEVKGDRMAAQLSSLRHEAKFAKARRTREMDRRAMANAKATARAEAALSALKPDLGAFEGLGLTCALTGDSALEVMSQSHADTMCWALRVERPEHAVEAPSQLRVLQPCVGTYGHEAFRASSAWAISRAGSARATGGFCGGAPAAAATDGSKGCAALGEEGEGLFKGPDGVPMNACLPLYLNEHHWARVEAQLPPVLAYFFTLDPLGFKGDQYVALYSILGQMLAMRAGGRWARSDWGDWLLRDFTQLCRAVRKPALAYLEKGHYGPYGTRGDLLADFARDPRLRSKQALPELMVLVGWAAAADDDGDAARALCATPRLHLLFVQELWRRALGAHYKSRPALADEVLERLVYGADARGAMSAEGAAAADARAGDDTGDGAADREAQHARCARLHFGLLGKREAKRAIAQSKARSRRLKAEGAAQQQPPGAAQRRAEKGYTPRRPVAYEGAARIVALDALVDAELAKIAARCMDVGSLLHGDGGGCLESAFDGATRRLMLVQALQHRRNDAYNRAAERGTLVDTLGAVEAAGGAATASALEALAHELHAASERRRRESWAALVRERADLERAKRCVRARSDLAFAWRLLRACPNRGGDVFTNVVALLCEGNIDGVPIPRLAIKVRVLMTGTLRVLGSCGEGADVDDASDLEQQLLLHGTGDDDAHPEHAVLSEGGSWVHCPAATVERLQDAVGAATWARIELLMHGTTGWVYRESDIPNRHGYHNSHPNPALVTSFKGFGRHSRARTERSEHSALGL